MQSWLHFLPPDLPKHTGNRSSNLAHPTPNVVTGITGRSGVCCGQGSGQAEAPPRRVGGVGPCALDRLELHRGRLQLCPSSSLSLCITQISLSSMCSVRAICPACGSPNPLMGVGRQRSSTSLRLSITQISFSWVHVVSAICRASGLNSNQPPHLPSPTVQRYSGSPPAAATR